MNDRARALVLLVDDYEDNRLLYAHSLNAAGFRVAEAGDGAEGLQKAFELSPQVIVMDLSLPVIDGWEAIRRLRADPRTRKTPVVALTGHAYAGEDNPGFDRLLVKPCPPAALIATVRDLASIEERGKSD